MLIQLLLIQTLFAQTPETEESVINEVEQEEQENQSNNESQSIRVQITLTNGLEMSGTLPFNEIVTWQPGTEGTFHFTPTEGSLVALPMQNVASVQTHQNNAPNEPAQQPVEEQPKVQSNTEVVKTPEPEPKPVVANENGFFYDNPAASRYLYAPSSIGLQKGQGYVSQKLVFTTGVYAISDNVTILLGAFGPFVTVTGTKISKQLNEKLHIGAGAELFFLPLAGTSDTNSPLPNIPVSIFFGSVTYGDLDQHITFASGYIHDQIISESNSSIPIMIAGHKRIVDRMAIVSENWILLEPSQFNSDNPVFLGSINSFAFRIIGRRDATQQVSGSMYTDQGYPRSTWDLGLVMVGFSDRYSVYDETEDNDVFSNYRTFRIIGPAPWIDYTWHFGPARK
jgi:hypothetical protein